MAFREEAVARASPRKARNALATKTCSVLQAFKQDGQGDGGEVKTEDQGQVGANGCASQRDMLCWVVLCCVSL